MMLVIYGPTATGKTDLALSLAQKYNGELISADSRQVYRKLDIGTGKVSFESKVNKYDKYWMVDGIKIYGFDLVEPGYIFSAADFLGFAQTASAQITQENKLPIVVGGTGFFIKALIDGIDSIGIPPNRKLRKELENLTVGKLYRKLQKLNASRANRMNQSDRNNPRRLIRAIEVASSNLEPAINNQRSTVNDQIIIGLTASNDFLYKRADKWLEERLREGLIEEVKGLLENIDIKWLDNLGLEYRWITRYLLGKISKDEAILRLKGDIHSFIRRQKTWFKKFPEIKIFDISQLDWQSSLEKTVKDWYMSHSL